MSSRKYLSEWIEKSVRDSDRPGQAVEPLVEILCRKKGWKYVEVWETLEKTNGRGEVQLGMSTSFLRVRTRSIESDLEAFQKRFVQNMDLNDVYVSL